MGRLAELVDVPAVARLTADVQSFRRYWSPYGGLIRVRALGGEPIMVRAGTTDRTVLRTSFGGGAHLPPIDDVEVIWDLGSNIGTTLAEFAHRYPAARILGIELNRENHRLAVVNTRPWQERVTVLLGAAWTEDGEVAFTGEPGRESGSHVAASGPRRVRAYSLNSLLAMTGPPDYIKMDVEGAERELLRENTDWAERARSIKVELHGSYGFEECRADLERVGFTNCSVMPQPRWPRNRVRVTIQAVR